MIDVRPAALAGLVAMLVATVVVGVFARRYARTTSDFLVAARSVPPTANAAAISGEYLSAASFLGVAGLVMQYGYDALWYPVCYAAGYLVLLVFIAGPLRRFGAYTIPDFAEGRFASPGFRRLAVAFVVLIGLFYMLPQMKAAGITVETATGVPYPVGVAAVTVVVIAIVVAGGMRGVTIVQAMQFSVKLFAISVPLFILLFEFGTPWHIFATVGATRNPALTRPLTVAVQKGETWTLPSPLRLAIDHPVSASERGGPPILLRSGSLAPAGTLVWRGSAQVTLAAGEVAPMNPQTPVNPSSTWLRPFGPLTGGSGQPVLYTYSLIIAILCGTMGLPHVLVRFYTNPDARAARRTAATVLVLVGVFYLWTPLWGALGRLMAPELYTTGLTDAVVLYLPRQALPHLLGAAVSGIVAAGAFAAFTATLSGLLISLAGAIGHDVYGRWLRPDASGASRRAAFRASAVGAGVVAAAAGLMVENFDISVLVGWAFAIAASSFFPLLVLGIWWRRLSVAGAAVGVAVGGASATIAIVTTMVGAGVPRLAGFLQAHSALGVILSQPGIVTIPLSFLAMVAVSLRTRAPANVPAAMLQLHVPDRLGLRRDYIRD